MYLYKMIFLSTLMMGTMISVSSVTWLGTWMGLEINLLSFIPLMKEKNNSYASESSMKYFLVQALASAVFFFSIIMISSMNFLNSEIMLISEFISMIINSSLLLKMGAAPFHFWFPEIIEGMSWINSLILMTWQKIAPMMILSYSIKSPNMILVIIIMCSIIGSIGGLNQTSLRKIMAFSSINHIGWMIGSFLSNEMIWLIYFSIYSTISAAIILLLNSFNVFYLSQMFILMSKNILVKFSMMLNLLSLGGLPPFLGFFPKWMIIQQLSSKYSLIVLIMILATLITLFFYMRIAYTSIIINHNQTNFMINQNIEMSTMNLMFTFMSLTGLTICTLMFNLY
uniref:NADH-ubiquinone oxidoreductase chain 2 n=1 Tax=Habrodera capensis TaxID=175592 RepID=A0A0S2MRF1_9CARA|nr:NADH deshydrogenase subunit 2 [Habrodera capensis]